MSILEKITHHHKDEVAAVKDAIKGQKLRTSLERRTYNAEVLIQEEIPEDVNENLTHKKHVALGKLHDFRLAFEDMLNEMVEPVD